MRGCECQCRPIKYTASTLEREWGQQLARGNDDACHFILDNVKKVKEWTVKLEVKDVEQPCSIWLLISHITLIINSHWQITLNTPTACHALSSSDGQAPVDDGPKLPHAEISEHGH